jgi:hypothetical protein
MYPPSAADAHWVTILDTAIATKAPLIMAGQEVATWEDGAAATTVATAPGNARSFPFMAYAAASDVNT